MTLYGIADRLCAAVWGHVDAKAKQNEENENYLLSLCHRVVAYISNFFTTLFSYFFHTENSNLKPEPAPFSSPPREIKNENRQIIVIPQPQQQMLRLKYRALPPQIGS